MNKKVIFLKKKMKIPSAGYSEARMGTPQWIDSELSGKVKPSEYFFEMFHLLVFQALNLRYIISND